ncbi:MAG: MerR family DNA-binding transcriptional regulator [Actinobacteria bacterium]|jgi:MerR family transcriptional regulator/heat shock protein HspR|nr:MAG: MerR family DNA-binding transcriptional regulator [Actinomycetota bacterium]
MADAEAFDWQVRLDDPNEPLFTLAVVSELFDVDPQVIRRMDQAGICTAQRTEGNHRRYSRNDIQAIGQAFTMRRDGVAHNAMAQILALQHQVATLRAEIARLSDDQI